MDINDTKHHCCSFCGKSQDEAAKIIAGPSVYICNECVDLCNNIIQEETAKDEEKVRDQSLKLIYPKEIKKILDQHVIGQDMAKKNLSVGVYNHYKRIQHATQSKSPNHFNFQKSNILLIGPTGTGKTLLAKTLADILDVPFAIADATTLTEAGYVGEDVENIILKLLQAADYDIEKCKKGIIYIDEIDKISRKNENVSITRDVSGEGVQQALLKIIEGTVCNIPPHGGRKHPQQEFLQVDTTDILFIVGGAFVGLDAIINKRLGKKAIGFGMNPTEANIDHINKFKDILPEDLLKFGMIPEFVGRLPVVTTLHELTISDLILILTEPQGSLLKQYQKLMEMDNIKLTFTEDAAESISKKSLVRKTGARGLRAIMEEMLLDIFYNLPYDDVKEIIISKDVVDRNKGPLMVLENETLPTELTVSKAPRRKTSVSKKRTVNAKKG